MTISDRDLITFLNQMPPEMKQNAIKGIEFLRCMTIADYKSQQIAEAEALITDVQNNPNNYSTVILNNKFAEILGDFQISEDLEKRIEIVNHFIGFRTSIVYNTDGSIEEHKNASYEDYINSKHYAEYTEHLSRKKSSKQR